MTEIIIATIMRPSGETGVQTHFNCFRAYLEDQAISHRLITPFSFNRVFVYPVFAVRRILHKLSGTLSLWWYRYWHGFFLKLALKPVLETNSDCVIYAQCPLAASAALSVRRSAAQRVILAVHMNISQADEWVGKGVIRQDSRLYHAIRDFEAQLLPKLDGLVFVSAFMQQCLSERIPALTKVPGVVIPNFLPDPGLSEPTASCSDLISIGSLEPRKNQQYLLEIMAALRQQGTPLSLTIAGDGPDRQQLQEEVETLKLGNLVHFAGYVPNAADLLKTHRALIHVASLENLPVCLLEALAHGRPLFAAPVGGIPEVLGDQNVGIAIPLHDAAGAAKLIADAMQDHVWMSNAGLAARKRFLTHYVSDVSAQALSGFLLTNTLPA